MRKGWNAISRAYQDETEISCDDVHYGALAPGESRLRLLGDVRGKDILELGCGGGQNSIALAKRGANASGVDVSEAQIEFAKRLAQRERVRVTFHVGDMEHLRIFPNSSQDIALSAYAIQYVGDLDRTFREVARVLRDEGIFVFSTNHPITTQGSARGRAWLVRDYFGSRGRVDRWSFSYGTKARFRIHHRTFQEYFDALVAADFRVERILEPQPSRSLGLRGAKHGIPCRPKSLTRDLQLWSRVPYTVIFKARKAR